MWIFALKKTRRLVVNNAKKTSWIYKTQTTADHKMLEAGSHCAARW